MITDITPDLIDEVIGYLSDPASTSGLWAGLCFMEAQGLDWSLRAGELHDSLTHETESPLTLYGGIDQDEERALLLALRQRARADLGLPPLTERETRSWSYRLPESGQAHPPGGGQSWADTYHASDAERHDVRAKIAKLAPELSRALTAFTAHNAKAEDADALSMLWLGFPLQRLVHQIIPALSYVDTIQFVSDLFKDERKRYE
jgi:hypothetical protein